MNPNITPLVPRVQNCSVFGPGLSFSSKRGFTAQRILAMAKQQKKTTKKTNMDGKQNDMGPRTRNT